MESKSIERLFLNILIGTCIAGASIAVVSTLILNPQDRVGLFTAILALTANVTAYKLKNTWPSVSVFVLTSVILASIVLQCFMMPSNLTTPLGAILLFGFIYSVMLKSKILWTMHAVCIGCIVLVFITQLHNTLLYKTENEAYGVAITYLMLYVILSLATYYLKSNYDKINTELKSLNFDLHEKANEIEAQNEELVQMQDNLSMINKDLEKIVIERTAKIQQQNDLLIKYSFKNAHLLRAPIARLLGLASVYKLEPSTSAEFIISKMNDEAEGIDIVIKQINDELDSDHVTSLTGMPSRNS